MLLAIYLGARFGACFSSGPMRPLLARATGVVLLLSGGCAHNVADVVNRAPTACEEPRPQVCTMVYRPVCARLDSGKSKTYANACGACADAAVLSYRDGACE